MPKLIYTLKVKNFGEVDLNIDQAKVIDEILTKLGIEHQFSTYTDFGVEKRMLIGEEIVT